MTTTFADIGVSEVVSRALAARGVTEPFAVQSLALPDALAGRDVLVRSRTGSGKTLAFAIPIVERLDRSSSRPAALILTPTRELASQVADEFRAIAGAKGLRVALAYGGVGLADQAQRASKAQILVATPGRLEDLINRRLVSLDGVEILVLDEADHMLDMGFLPQVNKIVQRISRARQTMLFSATLDGEVGRIAARYTDEPVRHEVESPAPANSDVEHRFHAVLDSEKTERLATLLREDADSTLVFVRTKHGADRLVRKLASHGIHADAMHGDKTQAAREKALKRFATGKVAALVATDVAARGIDVEGIARVVNYDIPGDEKAFVHRVGRTGRAGRTGLSITFVSPDQRAEVRQMATRLKLHDEFAVEHGHAARASQQGRPFRKSSRRRRAR